MKEYTVLISLLLGVSTAWAALITDSLWWAIDPG